VYNIYYLENQSIPYLIGTFKTQDRVEFEIYKFNKKVTNPEANISWIYVEEI
jgi:hypothetical protein